MARRLGLTKNIDIGICGDAKMAAEAIGLLLEGSSPACLETTNERLGLAKQEKTAWEQGKISLHVKKCIRQYIFSTIKIHNINHQYFQS